MNNSKTYFGKPNVFGEIQKQAIPEGVQLWHTPKPSIMYRLPDGSLHEIFETESDARIETVRELRRVNTLLVQLIKKLGI